MTAYTEAAARLDQSPPVPYYNVLANSVANPGGMASDGHRTALFAMAGDIMIVGAEAVTKAGEADVSATDAAASAATALAAPGTNATSATNTVAIGTGAKTLAIQAGKDLVPTMWVLAADAADGANYMICRITAYDAVTGVLNLNSIAVDGAGTPANWIISITGAGVLFPTRQVLTSGLASGGGDLSADRTINVAAAAAAAVRTGTTTAQAMTPGDTYAAFAEVALTDAATVTPDFGAGLNFRLTATGAVGATRQLGNPTNAKPGQTGYIAYVQDATGSRALTVGSAWKRDGGAPVASTTANAIDYIFYQVITSSLIIYSFAKAPA